MWLISGSHIPAAADFTRLGYSHFFGHWDFPWMTKNVFFIDAFMIPAAGLSVFAAIKGVTAMWKKMTDNAGVGKALYRPSVDQFIKEFLWPSVLEIVRHDRFKKCETNKDRVKGHQPLMWAFIGLLLVTGYSFVSQDILGLMVLGGVFERHPQLKLVAL